MIEAFYLLNCRSLRRSMLAVGLTTNPAVYWGILLVIGLQLAFTYLPLMNTLFESAPLGATQWLVATATAAGVLPLVAVEKRLRRRA